MTKVCQIILKIKTSVFCLGHVERWKEHCSNPYKKNKITQINLKNDNFLTHHRVKSTGKPIKTILQGQMEGERLLTRENTRYDTSQVKNSAKFPKELLKAKYGLV